MLSQRDAGVVARLHDHSQQQILDGYAGTNLDEHPRALCAPGLLADRNLVLELDLALFQRMEDDVSRHDLGQAGRRERCVGVERGECVTGLTVDDEITLGTNDRWSRGRHDLRGAD